MEPLKRKRAQFRRSFTMNADKLETALQSKDDSADYKFETLADCADELFSCEVALRDMWCEAPDFKEDEFQEDQEKACMYKSRWSQLKLKFKNFRESRKKISDGDNSEESARHTVKSRARELNLRMPKLEITKFNGEVKKWLLFWGQFKKIDADSEIDKSDKFQYLLQSMEPNSSAKQLVESYPPCGENYTKALEALKSRFARDDILIETYVRGLLALMQEKDQPSSNGKCLSELYDSLQTHLQALETLGVTKDKYASILFPMVESALPEDVLRAWNRHRTQGQGTNELSKLVEFLKQEVESEERIRLARQGTTKYTMSTPPPPTCCFVAENKRSSATTCIWCDKDTHCSVECHRAAKMSLQQRTDFLRTKKACTICLRPNHAAKRCKSFPKCLLCTKRYTTLMCPNIAEQSSSKTSKQDLEKSSNLHCEMKSTTLLQTIVVKVISNNGKIVRARALIDSGAQRSYIKKDLVHELGLKPARKEFVTHFLFGGRQEKEEELHVYDICVESVSNDFRCQMSVLEKTNICNNLPKVRSSDIIRNLKQSKITLTETTDSPDHVCILIGADFSGLLFTGDFVQVCNSLTAVRTRLGWTIQGPITGIYNSTVATTTTLHCITKFDISDLWNLETLGIKDPAEQNSKALHDVEVLDSFEKTITVNEEGRYEVCLPWLDVPRPQTNYQVAKRRLISTTNRLQQLGKIVQYDEVFKQWLDLGIIEIAPDQNIKGHYMPHHAVIKEASLTTKIRPVFDASAKDSYGISLNSCLEKGVNLLEQIPQLLINFRKEAIGVTADITKAFLQISLISEDRDYLRFLWWSNLNNEGKEIITYRHKRVVFGVASSPFHLIATINYHLDRSPEELMDTAVKLKRSFYVDNCVTSVKTEEALERFISESKTLMMRGKFDLRGWVSSPVTVCNVTKSMSVLGIAWNIKEDSLHCSVDLLNSTEENLSKRTLLSVLQRVFDPIGFICPTTIVPKIVMQKTWPRKLTWDEELPTDLAVEFKIWLDQAHLINECMIPRRLTQLVIDESENSLHVFCDASKDAYAVCIFLRSHCKGQVNLGLVLAKSRVTPISKVNKITIPRLELIAATLGTRLASTATRSLTITNCPVHYWTDSSVVLTWIKGNGNWSVFVTNRINEIKSSSPPSAWRHVPGHLNPADLPSRGISPKGLLDSRWWEGPNWLRLEESNWPMAAFETDLNEVEKERNKTASVMLSECDPFIDRLRHFSVYSKIVRVVAWILRWRHKQTHYLRELTYEEYERAETTLIKLIQNSYEGIMLKNNNMQTFVDNEGILRLETKLGLGSESKDFKYPIVLSAREPIVQRMVHQQHIVLQHAGVQTLMCNLRERFWIVGLRRVSRKIVDNCVRCKRFKAKSYQPPTGSLPHGRMEAKSAFEVSGVDLAGPLLLRGGIKIWIVLFTCATYRAVHLEVVESLAAADFIMALRRFIARRGRITRLYSDNGTNFRGVDNAMSTLDWNEILCFSSIARIKWNFLPPSAPWWGGFYERLVGVVKEGLRRVLGRAAVTLIELYTVLCDCEAVINSRPLTYTSHSQDELQPLTPAMFIQPLFQHQVPDLDELDKRTLNSRFKYCQALRESFRRRFRSEYVSALVQPRKASSRFQLNVGDIVLIQTDDHRRVNWPLGVIIEIFPGADGHSRVARVRTSSGEKVRPAQRLYPLEITSRELNLTAETDRPEETADTDRPEATATETETQTRSRYGRMIKCPKRLGL